MRVLFLGLLLLLAGCVTGQQVREIGVGMSRAEVIEIMGAPDGVQATQGTEVLKYSNRLMSGWSWDRTDYFVTLTNGRVSGYGNGEVRQGVAPQFTGYVPVATPVQPSYAPGMMCMKTREWITGMTKQCAYNCNGNEVIQTMQSVQLCPLNITR